MADSLSIPAPAGRPVKLPVPHRFKKAPLAHRAALALRPPADPKKITIAQKALALTAQFYLSLLPPPPRAAPVAPACRPAIQPPRYPTIEVEQAAPPTVHQGIRRVEIEALVEQAQLADASLDDDWQRAVQPRRRVMLALGTLAVMALAALVGSGATLLLGRGAAPTVAPVVASTAAPAVAPAPVPAAAAATPAVAPQGATARAALHASIVERLQREAPAPKAAVARRAPASRRIAVRRRRARRRVDVNGILASALTAVNAATAKRSSAKPKKADVDEILAAGAR